MSPRGGIATPVLQIKTLGPVMSTGLRSAHNSPITNTSATAMSRRLPGYSAYGAPDGTGPEAWRPGVTPPAHRVVSLRRGMGGHRGMADIDQMKPIECSVRAPACSPGPDFLEAVGATGVAIRKPAFGSFEAQRRGEQIALPDITAGMPDPGERMGVIDALCDHLHPEG